MTLQQLQYVISLEARGSFTAAADDCGVSQPTLSAQIKKLEDEWGLPLFDRSSNPIQPTPVGRQVAAEARAALGRLGALAEGVRRRQTDLGGTLEVGIIPTLAPYLLPRILGSVAERLPRVTLKVTEALTSEVLERLGQGRWDLGLVSVPAAGGGLTEIPLFREEFRAYLSPGHPLLGGERVAVADLEQAGLFLLREGHCFRDQVASLCGTSRRPSGPVAFESGSLDTLMRTVEAGWGVTLVPEGMVLDLDEDRAALVRRVEGRAPGRTIGLVAPADPPQAALVSAFADAVRAALPSRWRDGLTPP